VHGLSVGKTDEGVRDGAKGDQVSPETAGPGSDKPSDEVSAVKFEHGGSGDSPPRAPQDHSDVEDDRDSQDDSEDDSQDEDAEDDGKGDADYDQESDYEPRHQGPEQNRENIEYIGKILRDPSGQ
jgi:hypothetical protein